MNFSPFNPTTSRGRQIILIILRYRRHIRTS